jgi:hypothetical protein
VAIAVGQILSGARNARWRLEACPGLCVGGGGN